MPEADRTDPYRQQHVLLVVEQLRRRVPGGIGTYVEGLVQGLVSLGDEAPEATLFASRPPRSVRGEDPLGDLGLPLRTSPLPGRLLTRAWDRGTAGPPVGGAGGGGGVVHATSFALPPTRSTPLSVFVHDLAWRRVPDAYPPRGRRWHEAALERALARSRLFITPSALTAADLVDAGAPEQRVHVVEHGCDHLPPADADASSALLRRLGVEGPYLLAVGTLEPRKNLARLLQAYTRARPRLPDPWPLVVAGPTGWGEEVSPVPGAVLAGHVEPAARASLYARARCVAYVPLIEGFGLPVVEAMYACTPVVASPVPSAGGATLEVDPLDVEAIAGALVRASGDDRVRSTLVTAGLLRAGELTWANSARRHAELWQTLA